MKDFDIFYTPPAEIEQVRKGYTVRVIGGKPEYDAYMREKRERLAVQKQAQHEAYLARRVFLEGIVEGRSQATPQALHVPFTLVRFQRELGAKPTPLALPVETKETMPAPTWWQRVKKLIPFAVVLLILHPQAFAAFGGARSGGATISVRSSTSSARSYSAPSSFGGSRGAQGAPVTITRPTFVHEHSDPGGGLFTGMLLGHVLSQPAQAPVVIAQPAIVPVERTHGFIWYVLMLVLWGGVVVVVILLAKKLINGDEI